MSDFVDYYALLGIAPNCDQATVTAAFRREGFRWHPDRNPDRTAAAHARFVLLTDAVTVLGDPVTRRRYDARWRRLAAEPRTAPRSPLREAVVAAAAAVDPPAEVHSDSTVRVETSADAGLVSEAQARRDFERRVERLMWDLAGSARAARRARRGVRIGQGLSCVAAGGAVLAAITGFVPWFVSALVAPSAALSVALLHYFHRAQLERQAESNRGVAEHLVRRRVDRSDPEARG